MIKKSVVHDYFDEVFLVNLESQIENKLKVFESLKKQGITPTIWKAVNGYSPQYKLEFEQYEKKELGKLHFSEFNELELKRGRGFIESPGAWGYIKTYENIINHSLSQGFKRILILEDDVILDDEFENKFNELITKINNDWKILQLGASQYNWESVPDIEQAKSNKYYLPQILHTCGSFAIGIDLSVGLELLDNLSYMEAPFDHIPLGKIYERYQGKCFVSFPNLVLPDVRESTIRGRRDQVEHSHKMKWNIEHYNFPQPKPIFTIIFTDPKIADNINVGKSSIEKIVDINWLYYVNGQVRQVHDVDSTSLTIENEGVETITEEVLNQINNHYQHDYLIELRNNQSLNAVTLYDCVESLIINNTEDPRAILHKVSNNGHSTNNNLVSVIIPTYKRSDHLASAIESIIDQTYQNIEIIVVDDNIPDTEYRSLTEEKVKKLQLSDSRIKYIKHPKNLNGSAARNTGLMNSKGAYICFLDDDDVYLPTKIEECVVKLKNNNLYDAVYGGYLGWNSKSNDLSRYKSGDLSFELLTLKFDSHYIHTITSLYTKSSIMKLNGFDDSFRRHQDLEFNIRFFQHFKTCTVNKIVAKISPVPQPNSNRLIGNDLFNVKAKFLLKFKDVIMTYNDSDRNEIYRVNWQESLNLFEEEADFWKNINEHDDYGLVSFTNNCKGNKVNAKELDVIREKWETEKKRSVKSNQEIDSLKKEQELQKKYIDDLLMQKEWYESNYESLPWFWKKIGAGIRKLQVK